MKRTDNSPFVRRLALGTVAIVALVLLWWYLTRSTETNVPRPQEVLAEARAMIIDGTLLGSLLTSLVRVAAGFVIALVVGSVAGIVMARSRVIYQVLDPLIETVRPIAPVALVPLAILWLGTGSETAIAIIAYAAFFPVVLNSYAAVRDMGESLINAARTFGSSRMDIAFQVILPGAVPGLLVGARLAIGLGWAAVIAAELAVGVGVGSTSGIGQLMFKFYQFEADPNPIVVCMIAVGLVGIALDAVLREAGRLLMPWRRDSRQPRRQRARVGA